MADSKMTLNKANEKVDAELKTAEANAEKDQAAPPGDKFLALTEREREAVVEYLNSITKKQSVRFKLVDGNLALDYSSTPVVLPFIANAFGSTDYVFVGNIISQLANAVSDGDEESDLHALNFAVSMVNGASPRDPIEAALAAQMAAVHKAFMTYLPPPQCSPKNL